MGILLGEEDNTPDWDKEIAKLTGNAEALEDTEETEEVIPFDLEQKEEPFLTLDYNITPDEYVKAYDLVYSRDVKAKAMLTTFVMAVIAVAIFVLVAMGKIDVMFLALGALVMGLAVSLFLTLRRTRKMFAESAKALEDDRYKMSIYNMHLVAETIIPDEDKKLAKELFEGDRADAEKDGSFDGERLKEIEETDVSVQPEPTRVEYPKEDMSVRENEEFFLLFTDTATWFIIPKRCLSDEQIKLFKDRVIPKMPEYINLDD